MIDGRGPPLVAAALVATLAIVAACSDGSSPQAPAAQCITDLSDGVSSYQLQGRTVWTVLPASTDSCLTANPDSHFVAIDPEANSTGRLFVFLPGSGAETRSYRRIVLAAAAAGYAAVSLAYVNGQPVGVRCAVAPPDCFAQVREEVVTGADLSPRISVPPRESIEGRLVRLIEAMAQLDPSTGWGTFTTGSSPRWERISVAGHSQGGGHAFFIAQRSRVFRATAYSSAGDLIPPTTAPAPWVADPFETPARDRFGFTSELDELVPYLGTIDAWTRSGLDALGPPASVDGTLPPWDGSRMLTTRIAPRNPGAVLAPHHGVTVLDVVTPLGADDTPVFEPVWRAASFPGS